VTRVALTNKQKIHRPEEPMHVSCSGRAGAARRTANAGLFMLVLCAAWLVLQRGVADLSGSLTEARI
jgi:hypothetical protein